MPTIPGITWDMNTIIAFGFGLLLIYLIGRIFFMPIRLIFKLLYNGIVGGLILWGLNFIGAYFGYTIAINPVTAVVVGFLGLPGVVLLVLFKTFIG